jgi:hypothetical protein
LLVRCVIAFDVDNIPQTYFCFNTLIGCAYVIVCHLCCSASHIPQIQANHSN